MLKADHLTITTHKGRVLLEDFSFVLNEGEKIALIGEEGNGKSTLLKVLAGVPCDYVEVFGNIESVGKIAYLPQHLEKEYEDYAIKEYVFENQPEDHQRLYEIIKIFPFPIELINQERSMNSLSGGEKVKMMMVKRLLTQPEIFLMDEPSNDLDLETIIAIEKFIQNSSLSILFVSHDETLLRNCSTGILHLEQLKRKQESKMNYSGENYESYYERRIHQIDRTNQIARKEKAELNKQLEKYRRIYQKVDTAQRNISRQDPHGGALLKKKMHAVKALEHNLEIKEENRTKKYEPEEAIEIFFDGIEPVVSTMVHFEDESLYIGDTLLVEHINLHITGRDKVCIIGENGIGKTTLLKRIMKELDERKISYSYMPQNYEEILKEDQTPVDFLMEYADRTKASLLLGSLHFTSEEMTHAIRDLSQGQKCKILLAMLTLEAKPCLILDEPTRNLSPLSIPEIKTLFKEYDGCIIAVSHDRSFVQEVFDDVYELQKEGLRKLQ